MPQIQDFLYACIHLITKLCCSKCLSIQRVYAISDTQFRGSLSLLWGGRKEWGRREGERGGGGGGGGVSDEREGKREGGRETERERRNEGVSDERKGKREGGRETEREREEGGREDERGSGGIEEEVLCDIMCTFPTSIHAVI